MHQVEGSGAESRQDEAGDGAPVEPGRASRGYGGRKNQNGVTAELVATTQGVKFAIDAGGVEMKLK